MKPDISQIKTHLKHMYLKATFTDAYHYDERRKVERAIEVIEKYNGVKLTPQLKKTADDYAVEVFGSKVYAPWLYVYALIYGEFKEGWIPDNFFGKYLAGVLNKELRVVAEFKSFSNILFDTPILPDVAYYIDGLFYSKDLQMIDLETLKTIASAYKDVFVKADYSTRGHGVIKLSTKDIHLDIFKKMGKSCVIQSPIQQHEFFNEFMPDSVATLRIPTIKDNYGNITARGVHLRFGIGSNSWIDADSQISIPIINGSGDLGEFGYDGTWRKWSEHPDTHIPFANKRVPHIQQAIQDCIALHAKIPHYRFIGWDAIVGDDNQTKLIEWNAGHPGIKMMQATAGPVFKDLNWEQYQPSYAR